MDKKALRLAAMQARDQLTDAARAQASTAISDRLFAMDEVREAKVVFSYLAMRTEVDLAALHWRRRERGICLACPVVGEDGSMEAYAPDARMLLEPDRFGIRAPVIDAARKVDPAELDLILTPCVAFDDACRRLGHGGGYYDRYFERCPRAKRICIAFEVQRLPCVPAQVWDMPMDCVVTEAGSYHRK